MFTSFVPVIGPVMQAGVTVTVVGVGAPTKVIMTLEELLLLPALSTPAALIVLGLLDPVIVPVIKVGVEPRFSIKPV